MCWATLDRLLALNEKGVIEEMPRDWFTRERDRIRVQIESRAWNETVQSYVSVLDGDQMDATLLRLAWYGFEYPDSTRMRNTYSRVSEQLGAGNSLFYRYKRQPPEGAFGLCGFWAVEHLALCEGTLQQAQDAFQQILTYRNDVGLYAEETDPLEAEALGNFPQGFTHVGLISAALTLAERERRKAHPAIHMSADVKSSSGEANA
jgi:GH15 family glucan-1,4-alpha-glucosidase